jgi:uncharacterized membrane protein
VDELTALQRERKDLVSELSTCVARCPARQLLTLEWVRLVIGLLGIVNDDGTHLLQDSE